MSSGSPIGPAGVDVERPVLDERLLHRFRADTARLVARRGRFGLALVLVVIFLFTLADPWMDPRNVSYLVSVKLIQAGIVVLVFWVLRLPRAEEQATWIVFFAIASLCVTSAAAGILSDERVTTPLLLILIAMAMGTVVPWGPWPQIGVSIVAAASAGWNFLVVDEILPLYPTMAVIAALATSILVAELVERYRMAIAQRTYELDEIRHDFVGLLSHDVRTPLASILGFARILRDEGPGSRNFRDFLDRIEANARRAEVLASNFLEVARIDSGILELARELVSPNDVVLRVARAQESVARQRRISLEAEISPEVSEILLDRQQMERVLANLVANAIKFAPEGTTVHVQTSATDTEVLIGVLDEGPGVTAEDRDHLFDRYGGGGRREGSGLGLFIAHRIVEAHGGRIETEFPGVGGSIFRIRLPRTEEGRLEIERE